MRTFLTILGCLFLLGVTPAAEEAKDALTIELADMARDFADIIKKKGGGKVAVGEFSPATNLRASVSPRIQLALMSELKKLEVTVDQENYTYEIKGDYSSVERPNDLLAVKINGRLIDQAGDTLAEKPTSRLVFGRSTLPELLGANVSTTPATKPAELSQQLKNALKGPDGAIDGFQVKSAKDSSVAIEILVKNAAGKYEPRKVERDAQGNPLAVVNHGEVFGVRLINNGKHQVAVDLRLDGVNSFAFSEFQGARFWIVRPGKSVDVIGWHKNKEKSLEFKSVNSFADTAAAKLNLKPSAAIGLITASFSLCWEKDEDRPADEENFATRSAGFGQEVTTKTEQVSRTIGQVRDVIAVRYER